MPYAVSKEQLSAYGDRFNKLLTGRSLGFLFGGALTDIALSSDFKPFAQVSVQEGGVIYYPKIDAIQYAINLTECYVLWNGIIVGSAATDTPEDITRPINVPFGLFLMSQSLTGRVVNEAIVLSGMSQALTGRVWNVQILPDRMTQSLTGRVVNDGTPTPPLVDKTISYFACEEANGNRQSSHTDDFRLTFTGSAFINSVTGAVGDALPTPINFYINNFVDNTLNEVTLSLNEVTFIGYAFAFKFVTEPSSSPQTLFGNTQLKLVYDGGDIQVVVTDDVATDYTLTYSTSLGSLDPSNVTDWNLVIFTVNVSTGEIGLQLNNMAVETASCPTSGFASWIDMTFAYSDMVIDEMLVFDATLTTGDRDTLWNSGNFNTYPW